MKNSSKRRRLLKIVLVVLGLCAVLGGGIKIYTAYRLDALTQSLHKAKEKRGEQQKSKSPAEPAEDDPQTDTALTTPKEQQATHSAVNAAPAKPVRRNREESACSPVYQKYVENRKAMDAVPTAVEDLMELKDQDMENHPCVQQLTDLLDPDYLTELLKACTKDQDAGNNESRTCFRLGTLVWSVFAELEYRDVDPSEIPIGALHSKIAFRLADDDKFFKEAEPKDKEYLFQLMDQMHKLRPDIDDGTTRDELIAELHYRDPKVWKEDFRRILDELENQDLMRAITTFYKGHGAKTDRPFLEYVESLAKQYPENQVAHIYKGMAHAALGEWDLAAKELAEAERIAPKENTRLVSELRKSIQEKKASTTTYTWTKYTLDLPDSKATN